MGKSQVLQAQGDRLCRAQSSLPCWLRAARSAAVLLLGALLLWLGAPRAALADPAQGPGGPILVVTSQTAPYRQYYAEILRNEGLNAFAVQDVAALSPALLAGYDVVVLAKVGLSAAQVTLLSDWVNAGGNLIAMAPDAQLAPLLGLTPEGTTLANGYLLVDTAASPGNGIAGQTLQYHGVADRYLLSGASAIATLYSSPSTPTVYPAVTLHAVGSGKAAAFTYDLASSVVMTRQGNPAWAAQERDGFVPIRSDDKFYGAAAGDPQADWVDLSKVAIPQADEQQRLFANLILHMNAGTKPLPRFWYFPNGKKAVVVMTGDDHGNGGTIGRFDQFKSLSTPGCSVANWECVRGTSYIFAYTPLTDAQAAAYDAEGFEVGLHINTGCADYTPATLEQTYLSQLADWTAKYTSVPAPVTQRHHCIAWSDWTTAAQVQLNHGMRLDTTYYYWPPSWANNVPGLFTGSAMPMRFSDPDGALIDVYQAATQMTDESGQAYPYTVDTLLDRALGAEGYYGAYTVNAHTDLAQITESTTVVASAQARNVPVVSSRQMLSWLDGRNGSSFSAFSWSGGVLGFTLTPAPGANGLQAMLPLHSGANVLTALARGASPVAYTVSSVKGVEYAMFAADAGSYQASYSGDTGAPSVTGTTPASGATGVAVGSIVTATFSEAINPATLTTASFELRNAANALVAATVAYDAATRTARLTPSAPLAATGSYTATLIGGPSGARDLAGNGLAASVSWSFTTGNVTPPPVCPCYGWNSTAVPANPSVADPGPVELGVKFSSDISGYVTGVRFYKGNGNTGTHIGNLWSASGQSLASATFIGESASGWQQVDFATPVAITANTVYVASYFAPNGNYAADGLYFQNSGLDNPPVHLLSAAASGGNGVYAYGSASSFPSSSFNNTNYWVDVVFTNVAPADGTPPLVSSVSPASGATGVAIGAAITATFSEAVDPATVGSTTFELRDAANSLVTATVSYDAGTRTATLTPSAPLAASTAYTASLRGGASDPRIKDLAGNPLGASLSWSFTTGVVGGNCGAPANAIVAENCLTGNPASEWDISGVGDVNHQGFATDISVNRGGTISFKMDSPSTAYRFDIYRMGYYGGMGARKVTTVLPSASLPQNQPDCLNDAATGLIDCGNWAVSGSWTVPATAVSGIYFAKVQRTDTGGASHIFFVVRNDASNSELLFQTSDTTWQAYNSYGGNSLYAGSPAGRAYKVSYNRPFNTRIVDNGQDWVFNAEYPMVRWLEANGYDLSYTSGIDTDRFGGLLLNHRTFLSVGHDEYWSGGQRSNVESARNAGVNLAFFSGNEVFWKTRWENSIDVSATPYRTLVSYKETHANAKIDPQAAWTGTWRDPRFSPPADGGRPENALTGTLFMVNNGATTGITVPAEDGKMRLWRNTTIANLPADTSATLPSGTLGYEWDIDADNGFRPAGLFRMSSTTVPNAPVLLDHGSNYGSGTASHALTMYRHSSGAKVFGAGTIQWTWGLDAVHDRAGTPADQRMQQATVNLLADFGSQPGTLQPNLFSASASTDTTAPTSAITSPAAGANLPLATTVTISGTASDSGGVVGGVEVSVDGGATWHPATGRGTWSYAWTSGPSGPVTIRSRAVDDSGNLETPASGTTVTVAGSQTCPCTIWPALATPAVASDSDTGSVNLGVKFRTDQAGFITALRFYKGPANTGTHIGALWTSAGQQLATATFINETGSGWQQVNLAAPVAIAANTTYVASYLAPSGGYAADSSYFANGGFDYPPMHALANAVDANGVYAYAATTTFPSSSYQSTNYWVDVVFTTQTPSDTTPPTVTAFSPASGATAVSRTTTVTATFSEAMNAATIGTGSFELRDAASQLVAATVSYNAATRVATLTPSATLAGSAVYTATVRGGATDPRVKDSAGNALAANASWSFTTVSSDTTPPTVTTVSPASGATGVSRTTSVTATFSEPMTASTITTSSFELRNAANQLIAATVSYNAATQVATLTPSATLAGSATFTATVRGGATDPRVKDAAGNALAANRVWSFTTVAADTTAPTVSSISPASNATGVSRTVAVTATFSEAMDAATVSTSTFELRNPANQLMAATVSYNATTRVATLTPSAALAGSTRYTATVRGGASDPRVKDLAGNALATSRVWSFTTVAADTTPPTVSSTSPSSGASLVSRTANITATFNEAMDASTISTATFELRNSSNVLVPAVVTYSSSNRRATLNPSNTLSGFSTYTVTVRGGGSDPRVKDVAGNAMASNRVWSFTTGF
ncbi:MAG TPA: Ig-like domain-containing protein [Ideonella sp.]|nr:Ig-like domain-containing protein [Ideonella sp.]